MSQSYVMPRVAFEAQEKVESLVKAQLLGESVIATEIFTGQRNLDVHEAMDARKAEIERAGGTVVHRTRIGRNTPCPCGSGLKFKKCCIDRAALVGPARAR